jgi:hypothetical protein
VNNRRFLLLLGIVACFSIAFTSCKKLNDATDIGGGLIPPIDNITTFDTTIDVESYSGIFALTDDSTRLTATDEQWLGRISNDPIFGSSDAEMFFELKPSFYRYSFRNYDPTPLPSNDSLFIDSVVLVMNYVETYGDTTVPQTISVFEMVNPIKLDSNYLVNRNTLGDPGEALLGSRVIVPQNLNDSVKVYQDTTKNQLRVRLNDAFGQRLLNMDSVSGGGFYNDSTFKTKFRGFHVKSTGGGNALMGFAMTGANTKLAIYYRFQKGGAAVPANQDTTVDYFSFTALSNAATYVKRTHAAPVLAAATSPTPDPVVFIQAPPGTFAKIKIPALATMSNRIVHLAELIMEQNYDISDSMFLPSDMLYVDALDVTTTPSTPFYRVIPYDPQLDANSNVDASTFGGLATYKNDPGGNRIRIWKFNISRYVQHKLTQTLPLYELRVFAPTFVLEKYGIPGLTTDILKFAVANTAVAKGRVRLHGGGNGALPGANPQRMRLRIVYSKI